MLVPGLLQSLLNWPRVIDRSGERTKTIKLSVADLPQTTGAGVRV